MVFQQRVRLQCSLTWLLDRLRRCRLSHLEMRFVEVSVSRTFDLTHSPQLAWLVSSRSEGRPPVSSPPFPFPGGKEVQVEVKRSRGSSGSTWSEREWEPRTRRRSWSLCQSGTMCTMHPICIRNKLVGSSRCVPPGLVGAFIAFSGASNLRGAEEVDRPDIQSFVCLRFDRWLGEVERLKVSAQDHVLLHLKTIC